MEDFHWSDGYGNCTCQDGNAGHYIDSDNSMSCLLKIHDNKRGVKIVVVTAQQQNNPNNKTTITVVGLRLSNRWEPPSPTTHRNSKLHDRAEIEQNSENKSY